jgi:acyl-CoA hydrolase
MPPDATVRRVSHQGPEPAARPASYSRVSLAMMTSPIEANLLGNVHGGEIMKLADSTAGAVAHRHSGGPAVTAAMDEMAFLAPVHVGDIVRTYAQVNWAGRSSMEIGVRVEAQPWGSAADEPLHVASAYFVFVAIDADGGSRPVPALEPGTAEELRRHREAEIRRAHRLSRRAAIEQDRSGQ